MKPHPRLVMAGTHSGVGKTTVTLSILAALRKRVRRVQPFKAGPDFIDPSHHQSATGRPSRNLDGWMLGKDLNRSIFAHAAADADISIMRITGFTLGYRTIENAPRCILGDVGVTVRGHEFHYSTLVARGPLPICLCAERYRRTLQGTGWTYERQCTGTLHPFALCQSADRSSLVG